MLICEQGLGVKKILLPILLASAFVSAGFVSVGPVLRLLESKPKPDETAASYETVKTEFISVSVFEGGAVKGYLSFRMEVEIAEADRIAEVTYHTSDFMFRRNASYEELKDGRIDNSDKYKVAIENMIKNKFGDKLVKSLKITDYSFDLRL